MEAAGCRRSAAVDARFYFKTAHNEAAPAPFRHSSDTKRRRALERGLELSSTACAQLSFRALIGTQTGAEAALHKRCGSREFAEGPKIRHGDTWAFVLPLWRELSQRQQRTIPVSHSLCRHCSPHSTDAGKRTLINEHRLFFKKCNVLINVFVHLVSVKAITTLTVL